MTKETNDKKMRRSCETMSLSSPTGSITANRVSTDSSWSFGSLRRNVRELRDHFEVNELRSRFATSERANDELNKKLRKKEQELHQINYQMKLINDKMHCIQRGEQENREAVIALRQRCKELEQDKQDLHRQLEETETQCQRFAKQCQTQEGQLMESSKLRAVNKMLEQQLEDFKLAQQSENGNDSIFQRLRKELDKSKLENRDNKQRIAKLEKDNGAVADTFAKSLQTMEDLRIQNGDLEQQLRRCEQRAHLQMQQERLSHSEEIRTLNEELHCKQLKLDEFEKASRLQRTQFEQLVEQQENRVQALDAENNERLQKMEAECNETIELLQSKLEEKTMVILSLREEMSLYMEQVMTLTSNLDQSRRQNIFIDELNARIESLQQDSAHLKERLAAKDSKLAEMTSQLANLEIMNESMAQEQRSAMESHEHAMESHKHMAADIERGLRQSLFVLQNESDSALGQMQRSLDASLATISSLQAQIAQQNEDVLQHKETQNVVSNQESIIQALQADLGRNAETLATETNGRKEMEKECHLLRCELSAIRQRYENEVNSCLDAQKQTGERIRNLEKELEERVATLDAVVKERNTLIDKLASINEAMDEMSNRLTSMEQENELLLQQQKSATESQRELNSNMHAAAEIEKQLREKNFVLQKEFDSTRRQLEMALDESRTTIASLEAQTAEQRDIKSQLKLAQRSLTDKECTIRSLQADLARAAEDLVRESESKSELEKACYELQTAAAAIRQQHESDLKSTNKFKEDQEKRIQELEMAIQDQVAEKETVLKECQAVKKTLSSSKLLITEMTSSLAFEKDFMAQNLKSRDLTITEMSTCLTKMELDNASMIHQLKDRDAAVAEVSARLTIVEQDKDSIIQRHNLELERHKRDLASREQLAAAKEKGLRESLSALKKDSDATCKKLQQSLDAAGAQITSQKARIKLLEDDIDLVSLKLDSEKSSRHSAEQECLILRAEIDDARQRHVGELSSIKGMLVKAEGRVQYLERELHTLTSSYEDREHCLQSQVNSLNGELEKLQIKLAVQNDEIRELQLIDLREAEDEIESLKSKLNLAEEELKESNAKANLAVTWLESELHQCKTSFADRERELLSLNAESQQTIERLQCQLHERDTEFHTKLRELEASNALLKRKTSLLGRREASLRQERDELLVIENDWKSERTKLENQGEILRARLQDLESIVVATETSLKQAENRASDLQISVDKQTELLRSMVDINKKLELEVNDERSCSKSANESLELLQRDFAAKEEELSRLERALARTIENCEEAVYQANMHREFAENDTKKLQLQLKDHQQDAKILIEQQKRIVELEDKVKRQGDFIRRKNEKDKILRDRSQLTNTNNNKNAITTPARGGSTIKPPRGFASSVKVARGSNQSTVSDVSSVSQDDAWELE